MPLATPLAKHLFVEIVDKKEIWVQKMAILEALPAPTCFAKVTSLGEGVSSKVTVGDIVILTTAALSKFIVDDVEYTTVAESEVHGVMEQ